MFQEIYNTFFWYYLTEYTYYLFPPDTGEGNNINFCFRVYHYEWFWGSDNVELWKSGRIPTSCKRTFIACLQLSSGDYSFVYGDDYGDKVVGLLQTTPESADILEDYIIDDYVIGTMGCGIL